MFPDFSYVSNFFFGTEADNFLSYFKVYGFFLFVSILLASWLFKKLLLSKSYTLKATLSKSFFNNVILIVSVFGILGAKLLALIEYKGEVTFSNIKEVILNYSGVSFLGGFLLAAVAIVLYLRKNEINVFQGLDAAAPALLLGYGVGRIGCHLSGDGDWGIVSGSPPNWWVFPDWLWGYNFPNNVVRRGIRIKESTDIYNKVLQKDVFPTSFYEFIVAILFCVILVYAFKRNKKKGLVFSSMLIFMGVERFFIEFIRINEKYNFLNNILSQAQIISIFLVIFGVLLTIFLFVKGKSYSLQER